MTKVKNTNENKTLTAAQKIEGLEKAFGSVDQTIFNLTRQVHSLQDALILLNDKVTAMVVALTNGSTVTEELLDQINKQLKVTEMKEKVNNLLNEGTLVKSEEVTKNSFLVVREIDVENGKVINPRLQFIARVLNEESLNLVLGKKAGDSIKFSENGSVVIEIEEIYEIQNKQVETQVSGEATQQV